MKNVFAAVKARTRVNIPRWWNIKAIHTKITTTLETQTFEFLLKHPWNWNEHISHIFTCI